MSAFSQAVAAINDKVNGIVWGVPALILLIGTGILMMTGIDFQSSITTMIANLTTFGPATGQFGAIGSYYEVEWYTKLFLSVVMWLGRLEILTGLILLTPGFWKEYLMSRRVKRGKPMATRFRH